jgi:hypothetical protein
MPNVARRGSQVSVSCSRNTPSSFSSRSKSLQHGFFENETADPEQSFSFVVGPDTTSFVVPGALVVPGSEFQIGVASVHENGNIVFSETTFSTAD